MSKLANSIVNKPIFENPIKFHSKTFSINKYKMNIRNINSKYLRSIFIFFLNFQKIALKEHMIMKKFIGAGPIIIKSGHRKKKNLIKFSKLKNLTELVIKI